MDAAASPRERLAPASGDAAFEWVHRGTGPLRLNLRGSSHRRLVMRQESSAGGTGTRLLINTLVTPSMAWEHKPGSDSRFVRATLRVVASHDSPEVVPCLLYFRSAEDADRVSSALASAS